MHKILRPAKALLAVAGLIVLQISGDALVSKAGWPIPGALVGLLMLFGLLALMGRVPQAVDDASTPLLRHLMLFLIPSVAAVSLYFSQLTLHMVLFLLISTVVTGLALAVTAWTLRRLMKKAP
ncbi:MAG: CidA/LrgA family protein [Limnohabitans sp.]